MKLVVFLVTSLVSFELVVAQCRTSWGTRSRLDPVFYHAKIDVSKVTVGHTFIHHFRFPAMLSDEQHSPIIRAIDLHVTNSKGVCSTLLSGGVGHRFAHLKLETHENNITFGIDIYTFNIRPIVSNRDRNYIYTTTERY